MNGPDRVREGSAHLFSPALLPGLLLLLAPLLHPGCVTTSQGRKMERDILALQAQFDELRSEKERLKETLDRAKEEMRKLEAANGQATELFQRNTADFGVQVDRLRIEMSQLKGQLETLQHELELLKRGGGVAPAAGTLTAGGGLTAPAAL
ncbi:MAG: hypothetical protein FJ125_15625, partial [Deltaproteobacteria bacterium]|nr:hypothetical protein [Deltaproteobacteria bacterium]